MKDFLVGVVGSFSEGVVQKLMVNKSSKIKNMRIFFMSRAVPTYLY